MIRRMRPIYTGYITAMPTEQRLKPHPCDALVLSVQAVENDDNDTVKSAASTAVDDGRIEAYWGSDNAAVHPVYPAQTVPFYIGVHDASDLCVRCNKQSSDGVIVGYTLFEFLDEE